MCALLLGALLLELARNVEETGSGTRKYVGPVARQTIEDLCAEVCASLDYAWTLDELIERSGYHATQLSNLFHVVTGMSPWRWLTEQRVGRARELLEHSERTVDAIALDVGFGSRSQFHRAFRQVTGITPARYRVIMRHEQQG